MPDVYAAIREAEPAVLEQLMSTLELRAADPAQQEMRDAYLSQLALPENARVVEVGCGTGPVVRALASRPGVCDVVGVDPSPAFLAKARELADGIPNVEFVEGDARELPLEDASFDAVVFHTTLCHVPGPVQALAEAFRVGRPGGWLAVFDGDYATVTCANGDSDPLQACADATVAYLVHDRWLVRRLPMLVREAGFEAADLRGHSYVESPSSRGYMLAILDRGADALAAAGRIGAEAAEALKAEARRRSDAGEFFAQISYVALLARMPES
jgi:ubiquinone/menaquinone biosynthesis C-methylase UbiE